MNEIRSENYTITLYPQENEEDKRILDYIILNFEYAYSVHNKDIDQETGELKKEHTHVVIMLENARTLESISKEINIEQNRVERVRNKRKMIRYLIHMDNKEKTQYNKDNIISNCLEKIEKYLKENNETSEVKEIFEWIYTVDRYLYYHEVIEYVIYKNYYATFRRGQGIFRQIIEEHNKLYLEKKESEKMKEEYIKKEISKWESEKATTKNKAKKWIYQ